MFLYFVGLISGVIVATAFIMDYQINKKGNLEKEENKNED